MIKKINDTFGIRRAPGESVVEFREKVDDVMMRYGFVQSGNFDIGGDVRVHTYFGTGGQYLEYRILMGEKRDPLFKLGGYSKPDETFDAIISLRVIPNNIAKGLVRDLANYEEVDCEESLDSEVTGILKSPEETRKRFRERLDGFLSNHGFKGEEFFVSGGEDFLYKVYRGKGRQTIEAVYIGDEIEDGYCFNFIDQDNPIFECLTDAALIFNGIPERIKSRIFSGLEEKFDS